MSEPQHILGMVAQLAQLEQQLNPVLPQISQKLVSDLLATGMPAKKIAKVIGRKPSYVQVIANGGASLSAQLIVKLVHSAQASARAASVPANVEQEAANVTRQE